MSYKLPDYIPPGGAIPMRQLGDNLKKILTFYWQKDEWGEYILDRERRKPINIVGPTGCGKTQEVHRIAKEIGIGFIKINGSSLRYNTIAGLPYTVDFELDGKPMKATAQTIPDLIRQVYEASREQGQKEGILLIDELYSIDETIRPSLYDFFQFGLIGDFKLPEGWVIVGTSNPEGLENRAAMEFESALQSRTQLIYVYPDMESFREYLGKENKLHSAIVNFLELYPDYFYLEEDKALRSQVLSSRLWEHLIDELSYHEDAIRVKQEKIETIDKQLKTEKNPETREFLLIEREQLLKQKQEIESYIDMAFFYRMVNHKDVATRLYNYYNLYQSYFKENIPAKILNGDFEEIAEKAYTVGDDEQYALKSALYEELINNMKKQYFNINSDLDFSDALKKLNTLTKQGEEVNIKDIKNIFENNIRSAITDKKLSLKNSTLETKDIQMKILKNVENRVNELEAKIKEAFGNKPVIKSEKLKQIMNESFAEIQKQFSENVLSTISKIENAYKFLNKVFKDRKEFITSFSYDIVYSPAAVHVLTLINSSPKYTDKCEFIRNEILAHLKGEKQVEQENENIMKRLNEVNKIIEDIEKMNDKVEYQNETEVTKRKTKQKEEQIEIEF